MSNSALSPLSTEEVVTRIKTVYDNLSKTLLKENPLFFGLTDNTPTISITFCSGVSNKLNMYHNKNNSYYLVENCNQVFEILKEMNIYRETSRDAVLAEYRKMNRNSNEPAYLVVTTFKSFSLD